MKKIYFAMIVLGLMNSALFAQDYVPSRDDLARFNTTKTLVVLEDNPLSEYNAVLKQTMPLEWKVTPFDFISWKQFEEKKNDPALSFIILNQIKFSKDRTNAKYNFMSLVLGGNTGALNSMPDLCSIPLSYYGIGDDEYSYKLGLFLRFMQNHVKLLQENPGLAGENIFKYYNKNIRDLKGKTLYFVATDLAKDVNTLSKIRKVYQGPVKLVTPEEIQDAIANREDIVFLHKVGPENTKQKARCYNILIGAADANFYYFDVHMVNDKTPDAFLLSDFKKLEKKI